MRDGQWRSHITVEEAGAAFERGGRFVDALAFYEAVANDERSSREEQLFARTRWVVSKQRQLELELSHGGAEKVKQIQYDIEKEKQALSLKSLDDIDIYPTLPKLEFAWPVSAQARAVAPREQGVILPSAAKTETDKAAPLVMMSGSLKFEFSRRIQRCNVTNLDTMATAFITVGERACGGEVDFSVSQTTVGNAIHGRWSSDFRQKMTTHSQSNCKRRVYKSACAADLTSLWSRTC